MKKTFKNQLDGYIVWWQENAPAQCITDKEKKSVMQLINELKELRELSPAEAQVKLITLLGMYKRAPYFLNLYLKTQSVTTIRTLLNRLIKERSAGGDV